MTEETKLILALDQIHNLTELIQGNDYESYLYSHLTQVRVELQRQLTNLQFSAKIYESSITNNEVSVHR